jgi:hypothetical protein
VRNPLAKNLFFGRDKLLPISPLWGIPGGKTGCFSQIAIGLGLVSFITTIHARGAPSESSSAFPEYMSVLWQ